MMYGYYKNSMTGEAVFDLFYRKPTDNISYAIMAGLEQAVEYIQKPGIYRRGHRVPALPIPFR